MKRPLCGYSYIWKSFFSPQNTYTFPEDPMSVQIVYVLFSSSQKILLHSAPKSAPSEELLLGTYKFYEQLLQDLIVEWTKATVSTVIRLHNIRKDTALLEYGLKLILLPCSFNVLFRFYAQQWETFSPIPAVITDDHQRDGNAVSSAMKSLKCNT